MGGGGKPVAAAAAVGDSGQTEAGHSRALGCTVSEVRVQSNILAARGGRRAAAAGEGILAEDRHSSHLLPCFSLRGLVQVGAGRSQR